MHSLDKRHAWLFLAGLILIGIIGRLGPHPFNATPLTAVTLFAACLLPRWKGLLVPTAVLVISNLFIGWPETFIWVLAGFLAVSAMGWWLKRQASPTRIAVAALTGSTAFYLISNFGVWATTTMYAKSLQGLWHCYVAGIPFFRNMLAGDLVYTGILFGLYFWAIEPRVRHARLERSS